MLSAYSFYLWWGQLFCIPIAWGSPMFGSYLDQIFGISYVFFWLLPLLAIVIFILIIRREYLYFDNRRIVFVRSAWYCMFCMTRDEIVFGEVTRVELCGDKYFFYLTNGRKKKIIIDTSSYKSVSAHPHSFVAQKRFINMIYKKRYRLETVTYILGIKFRF